MPIVRVRQGQIWWLVPRGQHLVLAGDSQGPLTGFVERLGGLSPSHQPPLLIHDPDRRLREMNDTLAALAVRDDALAEARLAQLRTRFARTRRREYSDRAAPVLVVVAPTAAIWPDLYPLLAPQSGVQVLLVLGDRAPFPALRAVCHRLSMIEIPDPRYPALPDAFRPAVLPSVSIGQALAWTAGGQVVWRGTPPVIEPQEHAAR